MTTAIKLNLPCIIFVEVCQFPFLNCNLLFPRQNCIFVAGSFFLAVKKVRGQSETAL